MMKKWMAVLALGLIAPTAFGQAGATAAQAKKAPAKILRDEIRRDKGGMAVKTKAGRAEHKQLLAEEKAEFVQVAKSAGTRAEKKRARTAVRAKYAQLLKNLRSKDAYERKNLQDDISSKHGQIKKLRQS